ncbi:hypothetical protein OGATHE_003402 [Ogataea polymorpha]|uniref:Uncharacterized protein n=1 Tax=Ogataea polymorpha TaxID=460523 RepID=A0A9P8P491_9ASCO|nr:hypothetical protein OGATHE_003402 [Ogataea polymorpha]
MASTQCSLSACSMADVPSMTTKMATVSTNHIPNMRNTNTDPNNPVAAKLLAIVMDHSTDESCACASERAHRRRYEAVWETQLRQNSMV